MVPAIALFSTTASVISTLPSRLTSPYKTVLSSSEIVVLSLVDAEEGTVSDVAADVVVIEVVVFVVVVSIFVVVVVVVVVVSSGCDVPLDNCP